MTAGGEAFDVTHPLLVAEGKGWREMVLTEQCLGSTGDRLTFASEQDFTIQISEITRENSAEGLECSF